MATVVDEKMKAIVSATNEEDLLGLLCEECGELIQAAQKIRRVRNHTTNVSGKKAALDLREEAADVQVMIIALMIAGILDVDKMNRIFKEKVNRWYNRTVGMNGQTKTHGSVNNERDKS